MQEDQARQITLHHFAAKQAGMDGSGAVPLEPALAELIESIEHRCMQMEEKADEVHGSLQVNT